ncbi:proteasomal ubiquitin receptor ADRM1 homolog [Scaptodrosophila lebanonensis]|uniref:Proteasomal ubiquitin receptor ADRM1 homolog n=1 Tax=Drosophila lebanonensis TaxID=7225 RepID=A0A6J2U3U6_DROLE|nr:proteasomal ubiquitin receptor ADRM1 homolog [Scaptodrosophila lebanonensis]XP_030382143.1 proteasomal ubiquitin receptor ADRM1 homolog [Scaptodrosophila lebanonensis]
MAGNMEGVLNPLLPVDTERFGILLEFKAGRMNIAGKMVEPDTRKGSVFIRRTDDNNIHFCWRDRISGMVELDLLVSPRMLEFRRVEQCKTGRVYVLKFIQSTRRLFFWMQEPTHDLDDAYCARINELLALAESNVEMPSSDAVCTAHEHLRGGSEGVPGVQQIRSFMHSFSHEQMAQLWSSQPMTSSATSLAMPDPAAMTFIDHSEPWMTDVESQGQYQQQPVRHGVDFCGAFRALSAPAVASVLTIPSARHALAKKLPVSQSANAQELAAEIEEHARSPQFYEALGQFSWAFQAGLMGPVMEQFGLSPTAVQAAYDGDLEQFLLSFGDDDVDTVGEVEIGTEMMQ